MELTYKDVGAAEGREWKAWFQAVETVRREFFEAYGGFDPLYYGETASVGVLANAAGRCALLALPECSESKIKRKDGLRLGRHDLWVVSSEHGVSWLFEFKVCWAEPGTKKRIWQSYNHAIKCAFERPCGTNERRVAGTIYVPYCADYSEARFSRFLERMQLVRAHADVFCRVDGADRPAFMAFQLVDDGRKLSKYRLAEDVFG